MIDPRQFREALAAQQRALECQHPTGKIVDMPGGSFCKACGQEVPGPDIRKPSGYFKVFPSA